LARQFGHIAILVNNAATNVALGHCLTIDDAQFDKMIEVNLKSAFRLIRRVASGMCQRGSGAVADRS
jgi:dehydrogenase/reductase SDR family member 4